MRQTLLPALGGPRLIALAAGGVVLQMRADANGSDAHEVVASKGHLPHREVGDPARNKAHGAPAAPKRPARLQVAA